MSSGVCLGGDLRKNATKMGGFGEEMNKNRFFLEVFGYRGCEMTKRLFDALKIASDGSASDAAS